MEFLNQNRANLVEQWPRRDEDVIANAVFQQVAADAARDERGDQHIRIE